MEKKNICKPLFFALVDVFARVMRFFVAITRIANASNFVVRQIHAFSVLTHHRHFLAPDEVRVERSGSEVVVERSSGGKE